MARSKFLNLPARVAFCCCLYGWPAGLFAQAPAPAPSAQPGQEGGEFTLRAFSRLTVVDVTVTDSKGKPVHALPQAAFTVLEDGKPQPIRSFAEFGKDTPAVPQQPRPLPPHIYTNLQPTPTTSAVNVLLLDSLNTGPQDQVFVKDEAIRYLKTMLPGTRIAIMGLGSKLRILQASPPTPPSCSPPSTPKRTAPSPRPLSIPKAPTRSTPRRILSATTTPPLASSSSQTSRTPSSPRPATA